MDPNATYEAWRTTRGKDREEHAQNLLKWISDGGFEPKWTEWQKNQFVRWCHVRGINP